MKEEMDKLREIKISEAFKLVSEISEAEKLKGRPFCMNHPMELFLMEFYRKETSFFVSDSRLNEMFQVLSERVLMEEEDLIKAEELLNKALFYNPADIETYEKLFKVFRLQGKWEEMRENAQSMYPFCFTRRDLALYYRMLGCYFLEKYKPDTAEIFYAYSNLYYESEQAKKEISYLEAALKKKMQPMTPLQLKDAVEAESYPAGPKKETLGILYHTACQIKESQKEYAKMLFLSLYQLTGDEEAAQILESMD